jgi:4-amino-4-deoxy-L-arabinose transferase-like glycosyltransferase
MEIYTEVFFSVLIFLGVLIFCLRYPDKKFSLIILSGFLLRSGLAFFQRFIAYLPDSTADAMSFERNAWQAAEAWFAGTEATVKLTGSGYYTRTIAWLYYAFGRVPLIAQFINVLMGTLVIFIVYKTALILFEKKKAAYFAAVLTALFPTLNLYSAITMRESVVILFLALSFYCFSCWLKRGKVKNVLMALILIFISSIYHGGVVYMGGAYLFFFSFYRPQDRRWLFFSRQLILGIASGIVCFSLFFSFFGNKALTPAEITPETISRYVTKTSKGRAAYLENSKPGTYADIAAQMAPKAVYLFFSPFHVRMKIDYLGVFDALLYFILFILSFIATIRLWKKDKAIVLVFLLMMFFFTGPFAWGVSNYGTAIRHRQKIAFLLIIMASYSLAQVKWETKKILK